MILHIHVAISRLFCCIKTVVAAAAVVAAVVAAVAVAVVVAKKRSGVTIKNDGDPQLLHEQAAVVETNET